MTDLTYLLLFVIIIINERRKLQVGLAKAAIQVLGGQ